jgi:mannose-6-phosphate isomerase-like protein (cupin superfamily)
MLLQKVKLFFLNGANRIRKWYSCLLLVLSMRTFRILIVFCGLVAYAPTLLCQSMPDIKLSFDSLVKKIPGKNGEPFVHVLTNKSITLFLFAPRGKDVQNPHDRDEFYFVSKGTGVFWCDGQKTEFKNGDLLFAAAGKPHRFENFSDDLAVWVVFYGDKVSKD